MSSIIKLNGDPVPVHLSAADDRNVLMALREKMERRAALSAIFEAALIERAQNAKADCERQKVRFGISKGCLLSPAELAQRKAAALAILAHK